MRRPPPSLVGDFRRNAFALRAEQVHQLFVSVVEDGPPHLGFNSRALLFQLHSGHLGHRMCARSPVLYSGGIVVD